MVRKQLILCQVGSDYKTLIDAPKRMRYTILPNQNFDVKKNVVQETVSTVSQFFGGKPELRVSCILTSVPVFKMESLKNTQLQIVVPVT